MGLQKIICGKAHGFRKNTKLKKLDCRANQLKKLDVSRNTKLEYLDCSYNQLKKLDVSRNTKLEELECDDSVQVIGYSNGDNHEDDEW